MARMDKAIKDYQQHLTDKGIKNIPEFIQSILDADITKGKYSRFLLDCFLQDKFRKEDLEGGLDSTVGQAITLFHKHKNKLPEEMRSVYKYDSPGDLWNAVKQFDGALSGKEIKKSEQDKIYAETEFVYEDENTGFKIITPLTEESAKWWGKGTRWCTSAENHNQFKTYAEQAPLLILIMPDGAKLQLWKNDNSIQFMDEADNEVKIEYVKNNWNILEPIIKWSEKIKYFPKEEMTQEICMSAINMDVWNFEYIPKDMRTEKIYKSVIKKDGSVLTHIPEKLKTEEMCKLAIREYGLSLPSVPKKYLTKELCEMAVKSNGYALEFVPKKFLTEEVFKLAVQQNGMALDYVPEHMRTEELCKIAVEQNGHALNNIPEHLKTEEMCKLAIKSNGRALFAVPEHFKTKEICQMAVEQNGYALDYVPKEMRTDEMYKLTVQQNGSLLHKISFTFMNNCQAQEICEIAIKQNGSSLPYVPPIFLTKELCEMAVQNDGLALEFVPQKYRIEKIYQLAVQQNKEALKYIPEELKEEMKHYVQPTTIPQDKYQQVFSEIRSYFPEKTLSLKL